MATMEKDNYFPALTGIRAIAAYMVFFHHYNPFSSYQNQVRYFTDELHTGVTFFFVLSGFLIAQRYFDKQIRFKDYIFLRFARIFPLFLVILIGTISYNILILKFNVSSEMIHFLLNATLLKAFSSQFIFTGIPQAWSLSVEELFYLTAPFIFYLIKKKRIFLILAPLVLLTIGYLLYLIFHPISFYGFFDSTDLIFNYTYFGRCCEFFIGIALFYLYSRYSIKIKYITWIGCLGCILGILSISFFRDHGELGIRHPMGMLINTLLLPLLGIAPLYFGLITERTLLSRLLSSGVFQLLGKSSYAFYLIHLGFIFMIVNHFTENSLINFLLIQLISIGLFKFIEEPVHKRLRSYIRRKNTLIDMNPS
ncbi:acyltransferase [Fluviicola taffensis]|uniref:acyltransferase family protein n=1 Tax=Fluviicola taffensis TaxID=191579 RepID=UPI003137A0E4